MGTEPEGEDLAVFLREAVEGAVERVLELAEVAEDGKRWWTWRKVLEPSCREQELQGDKEDNREEDIVERGHLVGCC